MFTFRTSTRTAAAVIAIAIGASVPAVAPAAPNQGGGTTGDSAYCKGLRDRAQRFNDIAQDARQPKRVRDFYYNRARVVIEVARHAGCAWATVQAVQGSPQSGSTSTRTTVAGPARRTARTTRTRQSFTAIEQRHRAKRTVSRDLVKRVGKGSTTFRVSATTTGDPKQDSYCSGVAELVTDAELQGDTALGNGQDESAAEWYGLSEYMIDVASRNGCRFQQ